MTEVETFLKRNNFSEEASEFMSQFQTMEEVWDVLMTGKPNTHEAKNWAFQIISCAEIFNKKEHIKIALKLIEKIVPLITNPVSIKTIKLLKRYVRDKATENELRKMDDELKNEIWSSKDKVPELPHENNFYMSDSYRLCACEIYVLDALRKMCCFENLDRIADLIVDAVSKNDLGIFINYRAEETCAQLEFLRTFKNPFKKEEHEVEKSREDKQQTDENLKPCPFCGCKKVYIFTHNFITNNHEYSVEVVRCDFCGGQYRAPSGQRKFAIEHWNKRVFENEER